MAQRPDLEAKDELGPVFVDPNRIAPGAVGWRGGLGGGGLRVFVETNFVLEMAFEQAQVQACEAVVRLAESGTIQLVIPAFCFIEPAETLRRRAHAHMQLQKQLEEELRNRRHAPGFSDAQFMAWKTVISSLVKNTQDADARVKSIRSRLLQCSDSVPVSSEVLSRAEAFQGEDFALHFSDAVVLASVVSRLEDAPLSSRGSFFLNRNKSDFASTPVKSALKQRHCELKTTFDGGLEAIRDVLDAAAS
ncbi:PIN domain-containing protein [Corallococcus sp. 4LFB]|uniref:PIN domain-containing protein n=1 Tax=Corallococcus sp. 4LFB TaxID=3383249 RepID=UPI0039757EC7